jgi:cAMP-dependent protein kinase regulator
MIFRSKSKFEQLDQYLARRDYRGALQAISEELRRRPENFNVLLRQAEILALAGDRDEAIQVYEKLARHFIAQGFYARAIAINSKILRLDPSRSETTRQLAEEIARRQEAEAKQRRPPLASPAPGGRPHRPTEEEAPPPAPAQSPSSRSEVAFFGAFPREALEKLLSSTCVYTFQPGVVLVREGEEGRSMFLIEDGTVEVTTTDSSGAAIPLASLGPGDFFGEVSVLTGRPRTATVVAKTVVTVIEVAKEDLDEIAASYPEVRQVVQKFYEERAHATVEAILSRMRQGRG